MTSIGKYRKYYLNRRASFRVDESGVELKLEDQRNYARSKFKEIYGLYDTDRCLYFVIKGKAYYILPKESVADADPDALKKYMERKCAKHFLHYGLERDITKLLERIDSITALQIQDVAQHIFDPQRLQLLTI